MQYSYDTDLVRAQERFSYFHDAACTSFVPAASSNGTEQSNFFAKLVTSDVGALSFSRQHAAKHAWSRDRGHIRTDETDDFLVSILLEGSGELEHNGSRIAQTPGQMLIYDTSKPFKYALNADLVLIKASRRLLTSRFGDTDSIMGIPFQRDPKLITLAADMAKHALGLGASIEQKSSAGHFLSSSFIDLVSAIVDLELEGRGDVGHRAAHQLDKIKTYAMNHIGDEKLTIEKLADVGAVSLRTLNRLFAREGVTPMKWIWEQRLKESKSALEAGRVRSVTAAALQFGFKDISHFSRTFKATFGHSPETMLRLRDQSLDGTNISVMSYRRREY